MREYQGGAVWGILFYATSSAQYISFIHDGMPSSPRRHILTATYFGMARVSANHPENGNAAKSAMSGLILPGQWSARREWLRGQPSRCPSPPDGGRRGGRRQSRRVTSLRWR